MRLYVLLIAHMLADFTLQTNEMARKKKEEWKYLLIHCGIYGAVMALACFSCMRAGSAFGMAALFAGTHLLIDWVRTRFDARYEKDSMIALGSFLADQVLHIGTILAVCWLVRDQKPEGWLMYLTGNAALKQFLRELLWEGCTLNQLLRYSLLFVMIMDPASVLVRKLSGAVSAGKTKQGEADQSDNHVLVMIMDPMDPASVLVRKLSGAVSAGKTEPGEADQSDNHAGSLIGKLERVIIAFLVMYDAYGSIGFVLTAKSLARHDKLKDQNFAESYLVGTLSSTAIAMVLAQLLG